MNSTPLAEDTFESPSDRSDARISVGSKHVSFNNARRNLALSGLYYGRSPQAAEIILRSAAEIALASNAKRKGVVKVTDADIRQAFADFGVQTGKDTARIRKNINTRLQGNKKQKPSSDRDLLTEAMTIANVDAEFLETYRRNQVEASMRGYDAGFRSAQRLSAEALELGSATSKHKKTASYETLKIILTIASIVVFIIIFCTLS